MLIRLLRFLFEISPFAVSIQMASDSSVVARRAAGAPASASDKKHDMRGMDMSCMADMNGVDMSAMGPSMAAMECHMYVTPLRPPQPGDEEKAKAVVAAVKATMEKYKDYRNAIADGYLQANPQGKAAAVSLQQRGVWARGRQQLRPDQADFTAVYRNPDTKVQARRRHVYCPAECDGR